MNISKLHSMFENHERESINTRFRVENKHSSRGAIPRRVVILLRRCLLCKKFVGHGQRYKCGASEIYFVVQTLPNENRIYFLKTVTEATVQNAGRRGSRIRLCCAFARRAPSDDFFVGGFKMEYLDAHNIFVLFCAEG